MVLGEASDDRLAETASPVESSAEDCLTTVRDRGSKYDSTPACVALDALAMRDTEARRHREPPPAKYELLFEQARKQLGRRERDPRRAEENR